MPARSLYVGELVTRCAWRTRMRRRRGALVGRATRSMVERTRTHGATRARAFDRSRRADKRSAVGQSVRNLTITAPKSEARRFGEPRGRVWFRGRSDEACWRPAGLCASPRLTWTFVGVKIEFLDIICWGKSERISESKGWKNNLLKTAKHDFLLRATQDVEPDFSVRSDLP